MKYTELIPNIWYVLNTSGTDWIFLHKEVKKSESDYDTIQIFDYIARPMRANSCIYRDGSLIDVKHIKLLRKATSKEIKEWFPNYLINIDYEIF